jgi:hypothetical protein
MRGFQSEGARQRAELVEALDALQASNVECFAIVAALVRHLKLVTPESRSSAEGLCFRFEREAEFWSLYWQGPTIRLKDTLGQRMLAQLVAEPRREFHACDLAGREVTAGDGGELLAERARCAYRRRIEALQSELYIAEASANAERCSALSQELEWLTSELSRAVGLGGRARRAGATDERARIAVQRRIRHAISRIELAAPAVFQHLSRTIRTGMYCVYWPDSTSR